MSLTETAHAKINLYLHVTGKRPDGYHLLDSLVVFAGAADRLTYEASGAPLSLELTGPFGQKLAAEATDDNLVTRAARLLTEGTDTPLTGRLVLGKNLPVASGIGGGSADAAATLRLVDRVMALGTSESRFLAISEKLGADVPVCLLQKPALMRGIGEQLNPAPVLPPCGILLVNCGEAVSTPAIFKARNAAFSGDAILPPAWPSAAAMTDDLRRLSNDLEPPARALCPSISTVLDAIGALPDCLLSRMSGSGATCFGLFETAESAEAAARQLRLEQQNDWWIWAGPVLPAPTQPSA
ncbi:4-(cytidine 5'-diphospho)-2-C-methyl-D-erythritol kinase [Acetobacter sp.]|uniref:4-(cytidine 5'-diphospho)-2-C-methyl-D-erythritol kinase n=1 Tax=Acetobacter sp. TaxID=440 RepID=UPI0025B9E890|nr:4-(cytidine 5'-diphospho)-2-C-methyl-D-erythritol kinase [Acetobacter sp.]MCH4091664.1 4-(cytidine 5'-diphospho)-2-C-methyl-D-erythritol kinase [Acetobacter sp.]MCI1300918.1 4-(cytidine 5'-diphospho)-2-C-methyl-D-erythritol kinase [Acetobacter sp.]MCI1316205.1 4-(cytidine 5'-diphospho)-2-C-methyl-D-erythritol kinase [Acetobacter sp.]